MNVINYEGALTNEIAYETYLLVRQIGRIGLLQ